MPIVLGETRLDALQLLAARLLDSRKHGTQLRTLARDLLRGFHDVCLSWGLDRIVVELGEQLGVDGTDRSAFADSDDVCALIVARLETIDLEGRGPRNAKPRQVVDCLITGLGLTVAAEKVHSDTLTGEVRVAVVKAITDVLDVALAVPSFRDAVVADARARCPANYHASLAKVIAELDERGLQLIRHPKIPIDAMQASQHALREARDAVVGRAVGTAIDRARAVIALADEGVAARIDQPISLALTPRDVVIRRACDARVPKTAASVAEVVVAGLSELAGIVWTAPEQAVRRYSASATFAIGDVIEHPKFGRGVVAARSASRIDVEFSDGKHTLVHVP